MTLNNDLKGQDTLTYVHSLPIDSATIWKWTKIFPELSFSWKILKKLTYVCFNTTNNHDFLYLSLIYNQLIILLINLLTAGIFYFKKCNFFTNLQL